VAESWQTRRARWRFNFFPAFRGTGARVTYVAADWREVLIELPLSWRTRNYVGTIFGGSIYAACDPFYMIMLIRLLGPEYTVWDKAAAVRFRRPGRSTLQGRFVVTPEVVDSIRADLRTLPKVDRHFTVELCSADGTVHASVDKTVHISRRAG
jgi:acyl-coenzyme A thioesterase PaaI-like protein